MSIAASKTLAEGPSMGKELMIPYERVGQKTVVSICFSSSVLAFGLHHFQELSSLINF